MRTLSLVMHGPGVRRIIPLQEYGSSAANKASVAEGQPDRSEGEYGIIVPRRWALLMEGLAVGGVMILGSVLFSLLDFYLARQPPILYNNAPENAIHLIWSLAFIGLLFFIQWLSGDELSTFGYVKPKLLRDLVAFSVVLGITYLLYAKGLASLSKETSEQMTALLAELSPKGLLAIGSACLRILVTAASEELIFRGYLIPRLAELMGNGPLAVMSSAMLFGASHLYQGVYGALAATLFGMLAGIVFLKTNSIWPLIAAHGLFNVIFILFRF